MSNARVTHLDHDEVRWAREIPSAEKLIAGARLFDYACSIMMAGIRRENSSASDEQVLQLVRERLDWASRCSGMSQVIRHQRDSRRDESYLLF